MAGCCNKNYGKGGMANTKTVKKAKGGHESAMPKKMTLICKGANTNNPDTLQKH